MTQVCHEDSVSDLEEWDFLVESTPMISVLLFRRSVSMYYCLYIYQALFAAEISFSLPISAVSELSWMVMSLSSDISPSPLCHAYRFRIAPVGDLREDLPEPLPAILIHVARSFLSVVCRPFRRRMH